MSAPIEMMLSGVTWKERTGEIPPDNEGGLYATHEGVLIIMDVSFRCYRLNNGQAVLDADDVHRWLGELSA